MAGAGYRTFQSGEVLTSNNVQTYLMDQAVQVYAGTAARASAVPSPSTGMVAYATATGLQVFNGSAWVNVGGATYATISGGASTALGTAIGGTAYNVHTFTSDANLVVSTAGLVDVLLVAGGGGSSGARAALTDRGGGGGGAGGLIQTTLYLTAATYAVDVGAGGAGAATDAIGTMGLGSSIGSAVAVPGGGVGGPGAQAASFTEANGNGIKGGSNGGSGYLGVAATTTIDGITGKIGGQPGSGANAAGGGGGFVTAGSNGVGDTAGAGGNGFDVSTFGGSGTKATGGGGGGNTGGAGGSSSVNNNAGTSTGTGNSATANSGSGGGGSKGTGGNGASGIVLVRVKTS